MVHMVMAQLPKGNPDGTRRKLKCNKSDNILGVSYMYVGIPKKKFVFYVRERLTYRAEVEVTYEEVYHHLAQACGDSSISLHYTVNNQYVSIGTTGQLHTFFQHCHKDPNMYLYVENKDYVWNVRTTCKNGHKKKKRVVCENETADGQPSHNEPVDGIPTVDPAPIAVVPKKDCQCPRCTGNAGDSSTDDDDDDLDDEDEEEEDPNEEECSDDDNASSAEAVSTDESNSIEEDALRIGADIASQNLDKEPSSSNSVPVSTQPRMWTDSNGRKKKGGSSNTSGGSADSTRTSAGLLAEENDSDEQISCDQEPAASPKKQVHVSFDQRGEVKAFVKRIIDQYDFNLDSEASLQPYCHEISKKLIETLWPDRDDVDQTVYVKSISLLTLIVGTKIFEYFQQIFKLHEDKKKTFNKFFEGVWKEARNTVETQDRLNILLQQITLLKETKAFCCGVEWSLTKMPKLSTIKKRLQDTMTAVNEAFMTVFVNDMTCERCHCVDEIGAFLTTMSDLLVLADEIAEKEADVVEPMKRLLDDIDTATQRFIDNSCEKHSVFETSDESDESTSVSSTDTMMVFKKQKMSADNEPGRQYPSPMYSVASSSTPVKFEDSARMVAEKDDQAAAAAAAASNGNMPPPQSTQNPPKPAPKKEMSPELKAMVDQMMKNTTEHQYVYPPPPKPGAILIPIGGLARCRCRKDCQFLLNEPAYEVMERFNEPRQTTWEKTKQKRYKKN